MNFTNLRILDTPGEFEAVEDLQRLVWPGSEVEILPAHMLIAAVHNGGIVIGAYASGVDPITDGPSNTAGVSPGFEEINPVARLQPGDRLVGFVFGFPGLYATPDGPRPKHCSHMLAVHPDYRGSGLGFLLKRAQWQMVRHQGLDRITWTYDPLLSRNAHLNIARLGAVCNTYLRDHYGQLRDALNAGVATDRFQVDWWINSQRVMRRLSKRARLQLDLAHYLAAGTGILNATRLNSAGLPRPPESAGLNAVQEIQADDANQPLLLAEIPADFQAIKAADLSLAQDWRQHTRALFEGLFERGYLVTDFIHLPGASPRSFYVLSHGEAIISGIKKDDLRQRE